MQIAIQFPPQGIEVEVTGITQDGARVQLQGLEIKPTFYRADAQVPIMYGRVLANPEGVTDPVESHRFTGFVAGASGIVRLTTQDKPVQPKFEAKAADKNKKKPDKAATVSASTTSPPGTEATN